jgi:predicted permease
MSSIIISLFLVFLGLTLGFAIKKMAPRDYTSTRKKIQVLCIVFIAPLTIVSSVWVAPWQHWEMFSLPFICLFTLLLGGLIAFILAKPLGLDREQRAVFSVTGGFSNLGSLGGLICFMLIGEAGYALVPFYTLFEKLLYFMIGFPLAKSVSIHRTDDDTLTNRLKKVFVDPFVVVTLCSILLGIVLNITLERPPVFGSINRIIIPVNSFIIMISIGLAMEFGPMRNYLKPAFSIWAVKMLLMPVFALGLGMLLGLGNVAGGLPLRVILILGSMPVGFTALVPPTIYDLDLNLANTCWFVTTMGLAVSIPLLSIILPLL